MKTNNFEFKLDVNGYAVTKLLNMKLKKVIIPDKYENLPVVKISNSCFRGNKTIKEVIIPDSVTEIEPYSFESCENLKTVKLPKELRVISTGLFNYSGIETLVIPDKVDTIGQIAFYRCTNLKDITLPENLRIIKKNAFSYCEKLEIDLSLEYCERIEEEAFRGCKRLKSGYVVGNLNYIGKYAFYGCDNLTNVCASCSREYLNSEVFEDNTRVHYTMVFTDDYGDPAGVWLHEIVNRGVMECPCGKGKIKYYYELSMTRDFHNFNYISLCPECLKKYDVRSYKNPITEDYDVYYVPKELEITRDPIYKIPEGSILIKESVRDLYKKSKKE